MPKAAKDDATRASARKCKAGTRSSSNSARFVESGVRGSASASRNADSPEGRSGGRIENIR